jgi:hypothetical protein
MYQRFRRTSSYREQERTMRHAILPLVLVGSLSCFTMASAAAASQGAGSGGGSKGGAIGGNDTDPSILVHEITERRAQRESLLGVSPLKPLHDATDRAKDSIYEATHLRLGLNINHLFQWISDSLPGTDKWGTTTDVDFVGTWAGQLHQPLLIFAAWASKCSGVPLAILEQQV